MNAKLAERDFLLNCIINLPKYYVHDQDAPLEAEDYEYVIINEFDVFKKIVGLVMNIEYLRLSQNNVVLLFGLVCRVLHITTSLPRFKHYKEEAKILQSLYAVINHRDLAANCISLLRKDAFQGYRVRTSLLKALRLLLELHKNAHTIWQPHWNVAIAQLINL